MSLELAGASVVAPAFIGALAIRSMNGAAMPPVTYRQGWNVSLSPEIAQRVLDILFAMAVLLVALPVLILVAIAIRIDSPGPLFFVQKRIGKNGVPFPCIKFRTMSVDAEAVLKEKLASCTKARAEWDEFFKLRNDPRVTRLGRFVRKYSIDEFPQLLNVLAGQMAVVGPRPIVSAEIPLYGRSFAAYCRVRPGLTGLWQVSGRNDVSYPRRVAMDRLYVARKAMVLDAKLLALTIPNVLLARGSY
jgi:lipopolysaccharide/colanic/teichoic acid biosynthesis glycosyltransferase